MLELISLLQHDFGCRFVKLEGKFLRLPTAVCTADVTGGRKGLRRECTKRSNLQHCSVVVLSNSGEFTLTRKGTLTFTFVIIPAQNSQCLRSIFATMARGNFLEDFYCVWTEVYV